MCVFCFPLGGLARLAVPEADAVDLPLQVSGSRWQCFRPDRGFGGWHGFLGFTPLLPLPCRSEGVYPPLPTREERLSRQRSRRVPVEKM